MPVQQRDSEWIGNLLSCYEVAKHDWKRNHTPDLCANQILVFEFANSSLQEVKILLISSAILGVDNSLGPASDGGFPRCDADVAGVTFKII